MTKQSLIVIFSVTALIAAATACERVGPRTTEMKTVELGGAKSAKVKISAGIGVLSVEGGSKALMEGEFTTNVTRWKPEIDYRLSGERGILNISHRRHSGIPFGHADNRWDIRLTNDVPIELDVDLGAGETRLDLRDIYIKDVKVDMGVGSLKLDLSGKYKHSFDVSIDGGVGEATIDLPSDVGIKVRVDGGIGSVHADGLTKQHKTYTNDAYGKSDVTINISVDAGIGSVNLRTR